MAARVKRRLFPNEKGRSYAATLLGQLLNVFCLEWRDNNALGCLKMSPEFKFAKNKHFVFSLHLHLKNILFYICTGFDPLVYLSSQSIALSWEKQNGLTTTNFLVRAKTIGREQATAATGVAVRRLVNLQDTNREPSRSDKSSAAPYFEYGATGSPCDTDSISLPWAHFKNGQPLNSCCSPSQLTCCSMPTVRCQAS